MGRVSKFKGFWPLPGGIRGYVNTLRRILEAVRSEGLDEDGLERWMLGEYGLKNRRMARSYIAVVKRMGLLEDKGGGLSLTREAEEFLRAGDNSILLRLLVERVFGFEELLRLLAERQLLTIREAWEEFRRLYRVDWRTDAQVRWRMYWLLSLGLVDSTSGKYYLTEEGLAAVSRLAEAEKPSHADLVDKMRYIGECLGFEALKEESVNAMLPPERRLRSYGKRLDCLWVMRMPLGGKVYYPVEVQLGGSLSDTIDRLETVADFAKKAIVVTDGRQEKAMVERLKARRSKLIDKVVFLRPEEVYKLVKAVNTLRSLLDRLAD